MKRGQSGGGRLLVGILFFGDEVIDQADEKDSKKEETHIHPSSLDGAVDLRQGGCPFLQDLDKRDIEHDPSGESRRDGEEAVIGFFGDKGDDASNTSGHPSEEGQAKRDPERARFHESSH